MALRPINNSPYLSYDPDPYNMGGLNSLNTPMTAVSIPGANLNNIPATNLNNFVAEQEQYTDSGDDQEYSNPVGGDTPWGSSANLGNFGPGGNRIAGQHTPHKANRTQRPGQT